MFYFMIIGIIIREFEKLIDHSVLMLLGTFDTNSIQRLTVKCR